MGRPPLRKKGAYTAAERHELQKIAARKAADIARPTFRDAVSIVPAAQLSLGGFPKSSRRAIGRGLPCRSEWLCTGGTAGVLRLLVLHRFPPCYHLRCSRPWRRPSPRPAERRRRRRPVPETMAALRCRPVFAQ